MHELLTKLVHQLLELLASLLALEVVVLQALHLASKVRREHVELHVLHRRRVGFELLLTLIDAIALGLARLTQLIERRAFRLDDLAQRVGDVVVDAAEIVVLGISRRRSRRRCIMSRMPSMSRPSRSVRPFCIICRSAELTSP